MPLALLLIGHRCVEIERCFNLVAVGAVGKVCDFESVAGCGEQLTVLQIVSCSVFDGVGDC